MIDCSKCIHYEVCSNRFSNDGCEGVCGFYLQDIRPQGEWIENSLTIEKTLNCSICGAKPRQSVYGDYLHDNFCPNCGADMRGKKIQTPSCLTNPERQEELLERYKEGEYGES